MTERVNQRNAADEEIVKKARSDEQRIRDQELNELRYVLASKQGRNVLWRLLSHCRAFNSIWEPSARIHYNAGQQDVGHFILAEISKANEEALFQMMKDDRKGEPKDV